MSTYLEIEKELPQLVDGIGTGVHAAIERGDLYDSFTKNVWFCPGFQTIKEAAKLINSAGSKRRTGGRSVRPSHGLPSVEVLRAIATGEKPVSLESLARAHLTCSSVIQYGADIPKFQSAIRAIQACLNSHGRFPTGAFKPSVHLLNVECMRQFRADLHRAGDKDSADRHTFSASVVADEKGIVTGARRYIILYLEEGYSDGGSGDYRVTLHTAKVIVAGCELLARKSGIKAPTIDELFTNRINAGRRNGHSTRALSHAMGNIIVP